MDWQFALLLLLALVAMGVLSFRQSSRYTAEVNRLARLFVGPDRYLVSGRGKGAISGAIAVLVVDGTRGEVIEARSMSGVSVFATLAPAPVLLGPVLTVVDRAQGKAMKKAVEDALTRLPSGRPAAPAVPPRTGASTARLKKGSAQQKGDPR